MIGETDERAAGRDRSGDRARRPAAAGPPRAPARAPGDGAAVAPRLRRRWALADEAVALARETGDATTLAEVLRQAFYAYWSAETLELRSCARRRARRVRSRAAGPGASVVGARDRTTRLRRTGGARPRAGCAGAHAADRRGARPADAEVVLRVSSRRAGSFCAAIWRPPSARPSAPFRSGRRRESPTRS